MHISAACADSNDNIILVISSGDGTPTELHRMAINGMTSEMIDVMINLGDPIEAVNPTFGDINVEGISGLNPMTDNDQVLITPYFRVI